MATLSEYLKSRKPQGFEPRPHYQAEGDCLTFYFKDEESYAQRVDELLTVYLSMKTEELVGCEVKGVQRMLAVLGGFGISIKDTRVTLGLIFLAYSALSPKRQALVEAEKVVEAAKSVGAQLDVEELAPA